MGIDEWRVRLVAKAEDAQRRDEDRREQIEVVDDVATLCCARRPGGDPDCREEPACERPRGSLTVADEPVQRPPEPLAKGPAQQTRRPGLGVRMPRRWFARLDCLVLEQGIGPANRRPNRGRVRLISERSIQVPVPVGAGCPDSCAEGNRRLAASKPATGGRQAVSTGAVIVEALHIRRAHGELRQLLQERGMYPRNIDSDQRATVEGPFDRTDEPSWRSTKRFPLSEESTLQVSQLSEADEPVNCCGPPNPHPRHRGPTGWVRDALEKADGRPDMDIDVALYADCSDFI